MGIYFVRKTGNDTTGDGSTGNPWLTVEKAYGTVSTAGGHTINVGAGTYALNQSSSGRLNLDRSFVAEVVIQSESGVASDVILTGASGTDNIRQNGAVANTTFKNLTIQSRSGTQYALSLNPGTGFNISNLKFQGVTFIADGSVGSSACVGSLSNTPSSPITWGVTWQSCTFQATGGTAAFGLRLSIPANSTFNAYVYDCTGITALATAIEMVRCVGPSIVRGCHLKGQSGKGLILGLDTFAVGGANQRVTVQANGNFIESASGHGCLIGGDAYQCELRGNVIVGGDHGLVVKNPDSCMITENLVFAGTINALLEKGALNCTIARNTAVIRTASNGNAVIDNDDGTAAGQYVTSGTSNLYNRFIADAASKLIAWSSGKNGTGNTFSGNIYEMRSSLNTWGDVLADADIQSFPEIQAAFAAGGVAGAEANGGTSGLLFSYRHSAKDNTLYANVFDANGNVWNGASFVQYNPSGLGALASYAIPMLENPGGSYIYSFVWNRDLPPGSYAVRVNSTSQYGTFALGDFVAEKTFNWPDIAAAVKNVQGLMPVILTAVS